MESYARERERRRREHPVLIFFSDLARRLKPEAAERMLRQTLRWKERGRLVDFGCGDGAFLEKAARHFEVTGVEISPRLAEMARRRLRGVAIHVGPVVNAPLPEGAFDIATLFSVLEHDWRPLDALRTVARVLRPGGTTLIKVPNYACWNRRILGAAWSGYRLPDHCNYFTPRTLAAMLAKAGLKPRPGSLLDSIPTSDSLWMAAGKPGGSV
jgi:SAM-dependent methyltransferase